MKKVRVFTLSLILIFIATFNVGAYTTKDSSFMIEGYVDSYCAVTVTESGMPFDITGSDVKYVESNVITYNVSDYSSHIVSYKVNDSDVSEYKAYLGRVIATWDFASKSSKIKLTITASTLDLTTALDYTTEDVSLPYHLTFKYKYESFNDNKSTSSYGYITVDSGTSTTVELKNEDFQTGTPHTIIVSSQQDIRFMFADGIDANSTVYPSGLYSATVTIKLEAD